MSIMANKKGLERGEQVEGRDGDDGWAFSRDPSVRALLDHVAEELAAEFVRLMRASVSPATDAESEEVKR